MRLLVDLVDEIGGWLALGWALVSVFLTQRHEGLDRLARACEGRPRVAREASQPHHDHFHPVAGRWRRRRADDEPLQAVDGAAQSLLQVSEQARAVAPCLLVELFANAA